MRKSVWYHRFWQKKMSELPVNEDMDAAWQQMNSLLDQHFEIVNPKDAPLPKGTLFHHFIQIVKLIIPVVLVTAAVYFTFYQKTEIKANKEVAKPKMLKNPQNQFSKDLDDSIGLETNTVVTEKKNTSVENTSPIKKSVGLHLKAEIEAANQAISKEKLGSALSLISSEYQSVASEGDVSVMHNITWLDKLENTTSLRTVLEMRQLRKFDQIEPAQANQRLSIKLITLSKREQRRIRKAFIKDSLKNEKRIRLVQRASLKPIKIKAKEDPQKEILSPRLSLQLQGGLMLNQRNISPYLGIQNQWALTNKWLLGAGLRLNQINLQGEYFHPGYNTITAGSPFQIVDSRKLTNMVLPVNISYRFNNWMSLKSEANLAFARTQKGGSKVGYVASYLDTVFHTKKIQQALSEISVNKLHFNIGGGINIQLKRFSIEGMYFHQLSPYRVSSNLGSYQRRYGTFNVGLGYRF